MLAGYLIFSNSKAASHLFILIILCLLGCDTGKPVKNIVSDVSNNIVIHNSSWITDHTDNLDDNRLRHTNIPTDNVFRNDINNKKIFIILTFLGISVLGAFVLSFVNVHYDFVELQNFYRGYMGRRLMIQEGRLVHRKHREKIRNIQSELASTRVDFKDSCRSHNGGIALVKFDDITSPITTTSLIIPAAAAGPHNSNQLELESNIMIDPSCLGVPVTRRYVEDEGPEWRELDYYIEVGTPPSSFCLFFQQYDWNIYTGETLTNKEIEDRKNLLNQFRKWKKRKRKTFNIVVTERSRREMAEQEEEKNKKRIPPSK